MQAPLPPAASVTARQLLLGIRSAVAVLQQSHPEIDPRLALTPNDFTAVNRVSIETGVGSFKLLDLAPVPFAVLRARFGIREIDYCRTLQDERVKESGSAGKSGSIFVLVADGSCILKSLRKEEADTLVKFLPAYVQHIQAEPDTLLNRFLGLYRLKSGKQRSVYFLGMANCLHTTLELDEVYDIKGSTEGRQEATGAERQRGKTYKDLDFVSGLVLGPRKKELLMGQLKRDIELLEKAHLMDYSLIVGIKRSVPDDGRRYTVASARTIVYRSAFTRDYGGIRSTDAADQPWQEVYLIGVIDVLQDYNVKKQLAHGWKSMQVEEEKLSTVEPSMYASRFLNFVAAKIVARPPDPPRQPAPTEPIEGKGTKDKKEKKAKKEKKTGEKVAEQI